MANVLSKLREKSERVNYWGAFSISAIRFYRVDSTEPFIYKTSIGIYNIPIFATFCEFERYPASLDALFRCISKLNDKLKEAVSQKGFYKIYSSCSPFFIYIERLKIIFFLISFIYNLL